MRVILTRDSASAFSEQLPHTIQCISQVTFGLMGMFDVIVFFYLRRRLLFASTDTRPLALAVSSTSHSSLSHHRCPLDRYRVHPRLPMTGHHARAIGSGSQDKRRSRRTLSSLQVSHIIATSASERLPPSQSAHRRAHPLRRPSASTRRPRGPALQTGQVWPAEATPLSQVLPAKSCGRRGRVRCGGRRTQTRGSIRATAQDGVSAKRYEDLIYNYEA